MKDVSSTVHQEIGLLYAHLMRQLLLLFAENLVTLTTLVRLEFKSVLFISS